MEDLIEIKSKKEEMRSELDRIKQQIEKENARLESLQLTLLVPSSPPLTSSPLPTIHPLKDPTWTKPNHSQISAYLQTGDKRAYDQIFTDSRPGPPSNVSKVQAPLAPGTTTFLHIPEQTLGAPVENQRKQAKDQPYYQKSSTTNLGLEAKLPMSCSGGSPGLPSPVPSPTVNLAGVQAHRPSVSRPPPSQYSPPRAAPPPSAGHTSIPASIETSRPSPVTISLVPHPVSTRREDLQQRMKNQPQVSNLEKCLRLDQPSPHPAGCDLRQFRPPTAAPSGTNRSGAFAVSPAIGREVLAKQQQQQPLGPDLTALGLQQYFQAYPRTAAGLQTYPKATQGKAAKPGPSPPPPPGKTGRSKPGPSPPPGKTGGAMCQVCIKPANFLCSGCELVYYCTTACQVTSCKSCV